MAHWIIFVEWTFDLFPSAIATLSRNDLLFALIMIIATYGDRTSANAEICDAKNYENKSGFFHVACNWMTLKDIPVLKNRQKIKVLDLSYNEIIRLDKKSFQNYSVLEVMKLVNNNIHAISEDTFQSLASLKVLDLSDNKLRGLNPRLFEKCNSLIYLYLGGNPLFAKPSEGPFLYSKSLLSLDLSFTLMQEIKIATFSELPNISQLYLSGNSLKKISMDMLIGMKNLIVLDLERNPLECVCDLFVVLKWISTQAASEFKKIECFSDSGIQLVDPMETSGANCTPVTVSEEIRPASTQEAIKISAVTDTETSSTNAVSEVIKYKRQVVPNPTNDGGSADQLSPRSQRNYLILLSLAAVGASLMIFAMVFLLIARFFYKNYLSLDRDTYTESP